ncbi:tRNA (N6-isopentenyl adenosine(37)-C2)-methylthiotransferase MiaB [Rickettsia endosymbiont of Cardiosporidium cionae]|nr:tRNA (N6-isopentenyl adenosine(37)-C2)-methylthiotransferase MiaB [Rickettsia endosymbiont of Cardiosporidium cionae]
MNVYDSIKMQEIMYPQGFHITSEPCEADMVILNTCHIREKASEKLYSELGRIKKIKNNNNLILAVAGCVGQAEGEEIFNRAPYVDIVVGPQSYHNLPELVNKVTKQNAKHLISLDFIEEEKFDKLPESFYTQGASAFVSIQEGCDKFCTFCVVPYTRGGEFSRSVEEIYRESLYFVSKGSKEIYLLGQNVNAYHGVGYDNTNFNLAKLITKIAKIKGLERIRYTTSHPKDMSDELIKLHGKEEKLMPFLHLPVQSGSNKILKAMNRKHTRERYIEIIQQLRESRPDIAFSSDFIVGFPGETEEDFQESLTLVKQVKYSQCFSFKYSPRPGTPSALKEQLPEDIKSDRLFKLQQILLDQQLKFNKNSIGKILPILFDKHGKFEKQILGKTPYMQSVFIQNEDENLIGKIMKVKITTGLYNSLSGNIIN